MDKQLNWGEKMTNLKITTLAILLSMLLGCNGESVNPIESEDQYASLSLEGIESGLAKQQTISEETIEYGSVQATKTLMYLLVNQGNTAAFDVNLYADKIIVEPNHFELLPSSSNNSSILPIIQFTLPHVIPPGDVGSLWEFEIGEFVDTLIMSYNFINQEQDTINVSNSYPVSAFKEGIVLNLSVLGENVLDVTDGDGWQGRNTPKWGQVNLRDFWGCHTGYNLESHREGFLINAGTRPIDVEFFTWTEASVLDTILLPGDSVMINDLLFDQYAVLGPTHYILDVCGKINISVIAGIRE